LKPPEVPRPCTGGGGMTKMLASGMSDKRRRKVAINSSAVGP